MIVDVAQIEIDRKNVAYFEQLVNLYEQLIEGESSGLSQLQVDQAEVESDSRPVGRWSVIH